MREIELKAHVYDRPQTEKKINSFAVYLGSAEKFDEYWFNPESPVQAQTIRMRTQRKTASGGAQTEEFIVTCKRKEVRDGVEVNDENEFTVSDKPAFECLLRDLGYKIQRVKSKQVKQWNFGQVCIELCTLAGLGDFIEIEILSQSNEAGFVDACRLKLLEMLAKCGVPEKDIEPAYYSELLERSKQ